MHEVGGDGRVFVELGFHIGDLVKEVVYTGLLLLDELFLLFDMSNKLFIILRKLQYLTSVLLGQSIMILRHRLFFRSQTNYLVLLLITQLVQKLILLPVQSNALLKLNNPIRHPLVFGYLLLEFRVSELEIALVLTDKLMHVLLAYIERMHTYLVIKLSSTLVRTITSITTDVGCLV